MFQVRRSLFGANTFGGRARTLDPKFSTEVYRVHQRFFTLPPMYTIADVNGTVLQARYYSEQLQLVRTNLQYDP